ncbi:MAG TPA: hypothetical protein VIS75_14775 [Chitinophagaceae bacterium]
MKQQSIHYEILLLTGTGFTSRGFCSKNKENDNSKNHSAAEELEMVCWDGLIGELLPELFQNNIYPPAIFTWQVLHGKHFLMINMGATPFIADDKYSLDPYFFYDHLSEN